MASLTMWLGLVFVLLPALAGAAEEITSADDIVRRLLGEGDRPLTRGLGGLKAERRPDRPGAGPTGGRIAVPIQFKYDAADIAPASFDQLRAVAEALNDPRLQGNRVLVEGHTDNQGAAAYNQSLSQRRADAVRRFLIEKASVPAARLEAKGVGKSRPLPGVSQDTEEGRALNRRVEFVILGPADLKMNVAVTYEREGQTRTLPPGGLLTPKDNYRVTFTPNEQSYVYVYQIDAGGKAELIFPNSRFSSAANPVKAKQAYKVPAEDQSIRIDRTPGDEEIVVVASREELPDPMAIALSGRGRGLTVVTRGPAPAARADVRAELPPGVFSYRLPFKNQ